MATKGDYLPSAPPAPAAEYPSRFSLRDSASGPPKGPPTVHDRIARKAAAGTGVPSAVPGSGAGLSTSAPATSTSTSTSTSANKAKTPYILRSHRQSKLSSAAAATEEQAAPGKPKPKPKFKPTATAKAAATAENDEEELTEEDQQKRDLFGEDYAAAERVRRHTRQLDQNELKTRSVGELESYAIQRSQAVTQNIDDCVRVAEETVGVASATMGSLHEQGSQIRRVHTKAARVEDDLKVGEKLLGSLGGMFSRRWKPKKTDKITGPQADPDANKRRTKQVDRDALLSKDNYKIVPDPKSIAQARANRLEGLSETQVQLEVEKEYQEGALSDLGDVVSHLKNMSKEMNEEVEKQTEAMGHMEHDLDVVDNRVRQSYNRTRILVAR